MLTVHLIWRTVFVSVILMGPHSGLFLWEMAREMPIEHARTVAVNTLVMLEIFYLFNSRYTKVSVLNWAGLTGNRYVLIAISLLVIFQLCFTYLSSMQSLFGTTAISFSLWVIIFLTASSVLFLVELEKYVMRRLERAK
ncbi:cation transporting ATPase C-terminal domain-containing protein [Vibrio sp. PP-XX7]